MSQPWRARIVITSVLHTWGSALTHHPHVHMIVPGGGIALDGQRWVSCRPGFFLPVRVLSRLFRRLFLERLTAAHTAGRGPGNNYSGLRLAARVTLAHFSVSSATSLPTSAGEPASTVAPSSAIRALILGSARPALISLLSLSTISAGVPLGAPTAFQALASKPGRNSLTVGIFGNVSDRLAVDTASGRSLPARMCSIDAGRLSNAAGTCPPSRSISIGAEPR